MINLQIYCENLQQDIERFFEICFTDLGWGYEPNGRHFDIVNIQEVYMKDGCMWCLYDNEQLIGTVAIRTIDKHEKTAEMKRLYVLKNHQGKGYGSFLFETAIRHVKENGYKKINLDTRQDRTASLHLIKKYNFNQVSKYNNNEFAELFFELEL